MRGTPEGKLRHEQVMYFDKLVKIRDLRKPTIAAVQGTCSAAGLMLACMCDLIVAADDARFSNPVLRMSGVGVELLVEPWELGPRKAKEFLFCAEEFSAAEAERYGLVNRVVPRADLERDDAGHGRAGRARTAADRGGRQGFDQPHGRRHGTARVVAATTSCSTSSSRTRPPRSPRWRRASRAAWTRSRRNKAERDRGVFVSGALEGVRVLDLGTRIAAPFCAGLLGEQGAEVIKIEQPRGGDFMREIGPFVDGLLAVLGGRGPRPQERHARPAHTRRPGRLPPARGDRRRGGRELPAGHARAVEHRPDRLAERLVTVRISMFGQDGPYSARPGLDRVGIGYGGLLHLTGYPDRPPVRVGVTISDYLTGVFAAHAAVAALYARDARGGGGAVIDAALYGSVLRILEWTLARVRPARHRTRAAKATGWPTPRRSTTTPPPTASSCASSPAPTPTSVGCARRWTGSTSSTTPRFAKLADRAANGDTINGIVADWTAHARRARDRGALRRARRARSRPRTPSADIFADPHFAARHDLVTVDDPVIGPIRQQAPYPAPRRRGRRSRRPARPASASTPTKCSRDCSTSPTAEHRRAAQRAWASI